MSITTIPNGRILIVPNFTTVSPPSDAQRTVLASTYSISLPWTSDKWDTRRFRNQLPDHFWNSRLPSGGHKQPWQAERGRNYSDKFRLLYLFNPFFFLHLKWLPSLPILIINFIQHVLEAPYNVNWLISQLTIADDQSDSAGDDNSVPQLNISPTAQQLDLPTSPHLLIISSVVRDAMDQVMAPVAKNISLLAESLRLWTAPGSSSSRHRGDEISTTMPPSVCLRVAGHMARSPSPDFQGVSNGG